MAPSAKVTWPVLSILIFSDAESESPVENTKSVELTDEEKVASASACMDAPTNIASLEPASSGAVNPILPNISPSFTCLH